MRLTKIQDNLIQEIEVIKVRMQVIVNYSDWVGYETGQCLHNAKTKYRLLYSQLCKKTIKLLALYNH